MGNTQPEVQKAHLVTQAEGSTEKSWINSILMAPRQNFEFLRKKDIQQCENFLIIWLDSNVNQNNQIQRVIKRLENVVTHVLPMTNYYECEQWLIKFNADAKIIFVVSNELDEQIMYNVQHLTSITTIYRYSLDSKIGSKWIHNYPKVCNVVLDLDELLNKILRDVANFKCVDDFNNQPYITRMREILDKNVETQSASHSTVQIVVIDISKHLTTLAALMLKALILLTDYSIVVSDYEPLININTLPKKDTLLFVTSEFVSTMKSKPDHIKMIFILENDKNKVDHRKRFATGEDLICQLAEELYRYYKKEANGYLISGNLVMAERKENQANRIHSELKEVHKKKFSSNNIDQASVVTDTAIILLLRSNWQDDIEGEKMQNLFRKVISFFLVIDNQSDCHEYLLKNEFQSAVFLIIDTDFEESMVSEFQQLSNVKCVYRYVPSSLRNETSKFTPDCNDLWSRLTCDLITHYNKLGDDFSAKQDAKTAKDMFMKAYELCNILAELKKN